MTRLALGLVFGSLLVAMPGCRPAGSPYYPLSQGLSWSYSVRAGFLTKVERLTVTESTTVAGTRGWILSGGLGRSRLAWKGDLLVADELPGSRFSPPLPLLDVANLKSAKRQWSGFLTANGRPFEATATLVQATEDYQVAGRKYNTVRVTINLETSDRSIELITWYAEGYGPIRQEQRTNGLQDRALERLTGP